MLAVGRYDYFHPLDKPEAMEHGVDGIIWRIKVCRGEIVGDQDGRHEKHGDGCILFRLLEILSVCFESLGHVGVGAKQKAAPVGVRIA